MNGQVAEWPLSARVFRRLAAAVLAVGSTLFVVGFLVGTKDRFALAIGIGIVGVPTLFLSLLLWGLAMVFSRRGPAGSLAHSVALVVMGALCASVALLGVGTSGLAAGLLGTSNAQGVTTIWVAASALFFTLAAGAFYLAVRTNTEE